MRTVYRRMHFPRNAIGDPGLDRDFYVTLDRDIPITLKREAQARVRDRLFRLYGVNYDDRWLDIERDSPDLSIPRG